jgi:mycothiol synthase
MDGVEAIALSALDPDTVHEIDRLLDRVAHATGHPPLGEPKRLALAHVAGAHDDPVGVDGSTALLARRGGRPELAGYGQVAAGRRPGEFVTELAVEPQLDAGEDPTERDTVADELLEAAVATVVAKGGGTLRWWVSKPTGADDRRAASHGLARERDLVQMRCRLPLEPADRGPAVATRAFRPSIDEEEWLRVNNRSFATHPEQSGWDLGTLLEREREPWFDPDGFRVLKEGGRMAGSCWTKVHADADPPMGEIYVIGVDPDFQGRGFGRALTLDGLDWLGRRGLSVGMLYVDAANTGARALYDSIGFDDDHVDRSYVGQVGAPASAGGGGRR